jgi:hypothetical protein
MTIQSAGRWNRRVRSLLLLLVLACAGCSEEPDEAALIRIIAEMEQAVEAGEPGDFLEHMSKDFSGQGGGFDTPQVRTTLVGLKLRHEHIGVVPGDPEIVVQGDRATVKLSVLATGGTWMPETGQVLNIESDWRREEGEWRCFSAIWTEAF